MQDAATHLCEEAVDAGRLAPIAVFGGVAIVGVVGFCYILALLFSIGNNLDAVLTAPVPVIQIFTVSAPQRSNNCSRAHILGCLRTLSGSMALPRHTPSTFSSCISPAPASFARRPGRCGPCRETAVSLSPSCTSSCQPTEDLSSLPDRPLDDRFGRVNKTLRVPIWALALQTIVPIILSFIYLGSDIIFYAFFQVIYASWLAATWVPR